MMIIIMMMLMMMAVVISMMVLIKMMMMIDVCFMIDDDDNQRPYLFTGLCTVKTMVTPWTEIDTSKLPNIPVWSRDLKEILVSSVGKNDTKIKSRSLRGVGPLSASGFLEQFPKYQSSFSDVIDTNSNRLTTDGKQSVIMMRMIVMIMMVVMMMMMMMTVIVIVMMIVMMIVRMMMMMIVMMMMMMMMMMMTFFCYYFFYYSLGKKQQCSLLSLQQLCPMNCNCALQGRRER